VLSILTTIGMLAILVQMFFDASLRSQLLLSLLSWAVVLVLFFLNKRFNTRHHIDMDASEARARALLANPATTNSTAPSTDRIEA
jgi:GABA permease